MEPHNSVHSGSKAFVVGRDEGSTTFAAHEVQKFGQDSVCSMLVEIAGGFIGEHQRRLVRECACDGNSLLLTA